MELQDSWKDINELRLLTNVIKHGDGWSATELQKLSDNKISCFVRIPDEYEYNGCKKSLY